MNYNPFGLFPKVLFDIVSNLPTIALKTVPWSDFLLSTKKVVSHLGKEIDLRHKKKLAEVLPEGLSLKPSKTTQKIDQGELLLKLYFAQWQMPAPLFIDLRSQHFTCKEGETCVFSPSSLIYDFKKDFRTQTLNLYKGFYTDNSLQVDEALSGLGLTKSLDEEAKKELKKLFYNHFGKDTQNVHFNVAEFNRSFAQIFEFFLKHKIQLDTDFIFMGVYLISLYMHLESLGKSYNVKKIFLETFKDTHQ